MDRLFVPLMIITSEASLASLEQAIRCDSRMYRGAVITVPADGFRVRVVNLETGEELPEASPEQRCALDEMLAALKPTE